VRAGLRNVIESGLIKCNPLSNGINNSICQNLMEICVAVIEQQTVKSSYLEQSERHYAIVLLLLTAADC